MNDVLKKIALKRLAASKNRQVMSPQPKPYTDEDWVQGSEMGAYNRMGSDVTNANEAYVHDAAMNLAEGGSGDEDLDSEDEFQKLYTDLQKQKDNDVLQYAKLKELLNKK